MPRVHISKTPEEIARAKENRRVSTAKWRADKKKGHNKSINADNLVPQIAQASCDQSAIADSSSYASCEPPESPWSTDEIIEMVRFWDVSDSNNSGGSDDAEILTESLREHSTDSDAEVHLDAEGLLHKAWALRCNCGKEEIF